MNQSKWLSSARLGELLSGLPNDLRPRKYRLFACACLRSLRDHTADYHFRRTVDLAERFVEGDCDRDAFRAVFRRAWPFGWERARLAALVAIDPMQRDNYSWRCLELADEAIDASTSRHAARADWQGTPDREAVPLRREQVRLLREVFGDPFSPVAFSPEWRSPDVVCMAEAVAAEGTFDELPVLADALEDAGCCERRVLDHFRQPGRHALGCWALDLVRGRR